MEHTTDNTVKNEAKEFTLPKSNSQSEGFVTVPKTWVKGLVEWAKRMEDRERHVLVGVLYKLELNHLLRYILEGEPLLKKKQASPDYRVVFCNRCADKYGALEEQEEHGFPLK